jgi:hypothetical protein
VTERVGMGHAWDYVLVGLMGKGLNHLKMGFLNPRFIVNTNARGVHPARGVTMYLGTG